MPQIIETRNCNTMEEVRSAYRIAVSAFGQKELSFDDNLEKLLQVDALTGPYEVKIVKCDGNIVAMLRVLKRMNYLMGNKITTSLITQVCVEEGFRAQGIGARMVEFTLSEIRKANIPLAVLFARKAVDGYYSKFGFVGGAQFLDISIPFEDIKENRIPVITKSVFDPGLIKSYMQAYDDSYKNIPMAFCRSQEWWAGWPLRFDTKISNEDFINCYSDGEFAGYVVIVNGRIIEVSFLEDKKDLAAKFVLSLFHSDVSVSLPQDHFCINDLEKFNYKLSIRRAWNGGHMIALTDAKALKNDIKMRKTSLVLHDHPVIEKYSQMMGLSDIDICGLPDAMFSYTWSIIDEV